MKKLSLRPYHGNLYVCTDEAGYQRAHKRVFGSRDVPLSSEGRAGRFVGGEGADGLWTYLVWHSSPGVLAHELSHVLFHVFERCGMDPRDSGGEAFCYMLSQLMLEALE
ncbi:hypothetical protein [Roseateles sp. P5_E11]